jgi:CubicO group peptidase (beta-lactamase class C family)
MHCDRLLLLLLFLLVPRVALADQADDYVARWLAEFHVPGVALAVTKDGRIVKLQGYGLSNREDRAPVTVDTVFKIGSVSKQFIATAIMLLAREGRINLDESISKYFDDLPPPWKSITIRQMLSHTAGLPRESPLFDGMKRGTDMEIIRGAYAVPLSAPPGEKYAYSNVGYYVLAELISRVSRQPWLDYMTDRVFKPAGLHPVFTTNNTDVPGRARGYTGNDNSQIAGDWVAVRPSGAFMTSITKLVAWNAILDSDRLLTTAERQQMMTAAPLRNGTFAPYGFGWHVEQFNGHRYIWHGGGLPGFSSHFARFPDDRLTIIALSNGDDVDMGALIAHLAQMFLPAEGAGR